MRWSRLALAARSTPIIRAIAACSALAACSASIEGNPITDAPPPPIDSAPDAAPMPACPASSSLSICLSFDQASLGSPLANEGRLALSADLANVMRTPVGMGGAALLSTTSSIAFPVNMEIVNIVAIDARIRIDEAIPMGMRIGIVDSDAATPGMSMFVYEGAATGTHRIRCVVGGSELFADTTIALGAFTELACTCESGNVTVKRDGTKLAEVAGCMPSVGTTSGLQVGQNSRVGDMLPPNEPLVGAIDRVRLWTAVP